METSDPVQDLWRRFKSTGDQDARDRLVVHYAPLVKYVAGRVRAGLPAWAERDDLISDGMMGLMGAMDHFDVDRGLQFQTFAAPRIRGAILDGLRASDWVPRLVRAQLREIDRASAALEHRLQRRPRESELADELGISQAELAKRRSNGSRATVDSTEPDLLDDDLVPTTGDGVPGGPDGLPEGVVKAIWDLPEREQIVIALYYWERLSLAEIAQVIAVSESRASQLMRRATQEMRRGLVA